MNILPSCMYVYHVHAWYLRKSSQGAGNWTLTLCKRRSVLSFSQSNVAQVACSCLASGQILTTQLPLLELQAPVPLCTLLPVVLGMEHGPVSKILFLDAAQGKYCSQMQALGRLQGIPYETAFM